MTIQERRLLFRTAQGLAKYPCTRIAYVYRIRFGGKTVYVGYSSKPKVRWAHHKTNLLKCREGFEFSIIGIYEIYQARRMESFYIKKNIKKIQSWRKKFC